MMRRLIKYTLLAVLFVGGSVGGVAFLSVRTMHIKPDAWQVAAQLQARFSKADRLQIWKDVLFAAQSSKEINAVLVHDLGRDEYDSLYLEALAPTLKRYRLDRTEAFLIFEEEGGWPFPLVPEMIQNRRGEREDARLRAILGDK